jgi:hypothetical protein
MPGGGMTKCQTLTAKRLREVLNYDPKTGLFTWRTGTPGRSEGSIAGCLNSRGYVLICVDYVHHRAQRLAWLYMTGKHPKDVIDHRDGNKSNNQWRNLRDVTNYENAQNQRRAHTRNKIGVFGVSLERGKYRAQIRADGVLYKLGSHATPEAAHAAYMKAKKKLHIGQ